MMASTRQAMPTRCARCGGPLYRDLDDERTCLTCGEVVFTAAARPDAFDLAAPSPPVERQRRRRGRVGAAA